MKILRSICIIIAAFLLASCSGSSEAKTRAEQEEEFNKAFGFLPPASVTTIIYKDLYNRGVMDGAYGQWMSFTYDKASYDRILASGYKRSDETSVHNGSVDPAWWPAWWPAGRPAEGSVFTLSHEDTPVNEGFSFRAYI